MQITRDNYESWFLDYLEGHLEEGMVNEFIEFIHRNRDLKEELLLYEPVRLENENLSYAGKEHLYREMFDLPPVFENAAVGRLEGDQTPEEGVLFDDYLLRHPEKKAEADLFSQTKLQPDLSVIFAPKGKIYKQTPVRKMLFWSMRIAAMLILSWMIYNTAKSPDGSPLPDNPISGNKFQNRNEDATGKDNTVMEQEKPTTAERPVLSRNQLPGMKSGSPAGKTADNKSRMLIHVNNPVRQISTEKKIENSENISGHEKENISEPHGTIPVPPLMAALTCQGVQELEELNLTCLSSVRYNTEDELIEKQSLKEWIADKTRFPEVTFRKILRGGLDFAMNLSNDKFRYDTNKDGEIIALNLETHLLGLSIPVKK